jgi:SAM-dependent methyltransferase
MHLYVCPVCNGAEVDGFVDIPNLPVFCNVLWPTRQAALTAPRGDLHLGFCKTCGHIFNTAFEASLLAYSPAYENSLHFSPRFQAYAEALADRLINRYALHEKTVIDIGCGKGDFLRLLCERGPNQGIGFDPSYEPNLVESDPFTVIQDLYGAEYAGYTADLIACRHVLEHIEAPRGFVQTVRDTIGAQRNTAIYFEVPNVCATLRDLAIWDLIYEHCSYYSPASLTYLFESSGFSVRTVEAGFGGQYLSLEAMPGQANQPQAHGAAALTDDVQQFAQRFREKVQTWRKTFSEIQMNGRRVILWGAGSKGVTLAHLLQLQTHVEYLVDINPRKQGQFIAGTGLQIVSPDTLTQYAPDVVVIMNGLYVDEIRNMLDQMGLAPELMVA